MGITGKLRSVWGFLREGAARWAEREQLIRRLPGVSLAEGVTIRTPERFFAGAGTRLEEGVYVNCGGAWSEQGRFTCGTGSFIGAHSVIYAGGGVSLGDNVGLGPHVLIASHENDPTDVKAPPFMEHVTMAPVTVGSNVVIAMGAVILPGVTIGDHVFVAAGAVVTRDVPAGSLVMGVPARVVRTL